ncbi:MAG: BON domain-containing protein [Candidatus Hydrogenedentota bacterium]
MFMARHYRPRAASQMAVLALALILGAALPALAQGYTDQDITDAVEDEIVTDPIVQLHNIMVSTDEGVVTLTGTTTNLLAKQRAERIAATVKGVRAVLNRIDIEPAVSRTDSLIAADVNDALLYDSATDSYQVDVTVDNGIVTLGGTVDSWQEKQLAEKVAASVRGVQGVNNHIEVEYEGDRTDSELRAEIEKALQFDVLVDDALITVSVDDGAVNLEGTVGSQSEKARAVSDAWVAGVQSVDGSDLEVKRWARDEDLRGAKYEEKTPEEIKAAVEDALLHDPRVFSFKVNATEVEGGKVTLRGTVDNLKAKRAAAEAARGVVGVTRVENRIRVESAGELTDAEVADNVRNALARDPYVNRYEITVTVVNNTAYLYGTVDSHFEKAQADDVAARAEGVWAVNNNITVDDTYEPGAYDPYIDTWDMYDYDWYDYQPVNTTKSDAEIAEDIESQLWWSPFVSADDVNITVEDGTATLTGTVGSWSEFNAATENAFDGGATWVNNELIVQ